jgi:hypothetical protein
MRWTKIRSTFATLVAIVLILLFVGVMLHLSGITVPFISGFLPRQ